MTESNDKYWKDLTPKEITFLKANVPSSWFRDSTPERLEIVERILKLFNDGKLLEAHGLITETYADGPRPI